MNSFFTNALNLVEQVAILFVLIAAGFICAKTKLINNKIKDGIVNILLYVVTPCLIINSFLSVKFTADTITSLGIAAACAFISHIIAIVFSYAVFDKDFRKRSVLRFALIFSNAGYMGIPLANAVFGEKGVFYGSAYLIVFNVVQWTYGISIYKKGSKNRLKIILNPGTIGVLIGLPLFLLKLHLPEVLSSPIASISELNTPLAMFVLGYYFSRSNIKTGLFSKKMWTVIFGRMIIVPILAFLLFKYIFGLSGVLLGCCVLPASAPTAVNTIILASKFKADADLGLKIVTITTILSIITMPLILAFAKM